MVDTDYNTRKVKLSLIILAFVSIGIALTSLYSWIIIKLEWKAIVFLLDISLYLCFYNH